MSGPADRPFRTIADEQIQTLLLSLVERIGARLTSGRSRITHIRTGATAVGSVVLVIGGAERAASLNGLGAALAFNLALLAYFQLTFAWIMWNRVGALADGLDDLLSEASRDDRARLLNDIRRWHRGHRVASAVVGGALFSAGAEAVYRMTRPVEGAWPPGMSAAIILTGAIAGHSVYITSFGVWLLRAVVGISRMRVTWHAPVDTPALVGMSRIASRTAQLGLILLLLSQAPLIYMFLAARSPAVVAVYAVAFVITVSLITATGIGAQLWLSRRVDLQKRLVLAEISAKIDICRRDLATVPARGVRHAERLIALKAYLDIYGTVASTASSYLNVATITQYAVSLLALVLQFGVPVLVALVQPTG